MKHIKLFNQHSDYETYINSSDKVLPNVSYCKDNNDVHYNPIVIETRLIAKYNVEDDSEPTLLYGYYAEEGEEESWIIGTELFDKIEIDGVEVSISDIDSNNGNYQLSEGEHTVKYTLSDPTTIGDGVFFNCNNLTSVIIPDSVTSIGVRVFLYCGNLASVTLGNNVTTIGEGAFDECGITSVTIPNSVTSIGEGAFQYCSGLTSIVVNSGNSVYDSRNNCNAIIETATNTLIQGCQNTIIPNNITSIGNWAFNHCIGLTSVTIPNSVTTIGDGAFGGCSGLTSIIIPNNVTSISGYTFSSCSSLTSVTIPNSVTTIGINSFSSCSSLTSVTIPDSVTSIDNYAFRECTGLTSITIGSGITSIGDGAFGGCSGLTSITIQATTPPSTPWAASTFYGSNDCPIYVPSASVAAYKAATNWSSIESRIQAIP